MANGKTRASTKVAVVVGAMVVVAYFFGRGAPLPATTCTTTPLIVMASNEKSGLLGEMAAEFERTRPTVDGTCVSIKVVRKASGEAEEALARGWNESTDGQRPDVWSPAAKSWVEILRVHRVGGDRSDLIPVTLPSLIQSPLIIGMPRPMAEALGWPDRPIGWHDVLALSRDPRGWASVGHPEWGRFRLGKTNPTVSTSGLHALIGTYYAATGLTADLTASDVRRSDVVQFVKDIESSVEHYGNTAATFMRNLGLADDRGETISYMSAIAVEEKQLWDYNRGARRQVPLVAVYPSEGTLVADHPYVVLRAPWVDDLKRRAAALFLSYLESPERQQRFRAEGYRDHEGRAGPDLSAQWGTLPAGPTTILPAPSPEALAAVEASWTDVRKRARVLMVLDVSGSMQGTKIDLMRRGAASSLELFLDDDEIGLWAFSTNRFEVAPMGQVGNRRSILDNAIRQLAANGGTRLYDSTYEAVRELSASVDPRRITAVVVLTDGVNTNGNNDVGGLIRDLRTVTNENHIRVFTIGYGSDADKNVLQQIADATRGASYDASNPESIETVFREVISNF
jgi:Ca-activated chloride channel family protein